jgi:taurine--2-oxoglutarate transaminase
MNELEARQRKHILFTWTAQNAAAPVRIKGGQGIWFEDHDGRRWMDLESQVFNCNAGHGQRRIGEAIAEQALSLACAHPNAVFEAKAALGERLAAVTPGTRPLLPLPLRAEANENALKMARAVTGRSKVVARRRSYHGASMGASSLTGDPRRWPGEPDLWGVQRIEDPYCYRCPFGQTHPACGVRCADHLEHVIQMEGPDRIAAVFLEGVAGANGGFVPPPEYWARMREICDRYGILLVADEVFTGFGRTGKLVRPPALERGPRSSSRWARGSPAAMRPWAPSPSGTIWRRSSTRSVLQCGLTHHAHPISCAAAVATIDLYHDTKMVENAAHQGEVLAAGSRRPEGETPGHRRCPQPGPPRCAGARDGSVRPAKPLVPYNGAIKPGTQPRAAQGGA